MDLLVERARALDGSAVDELLELAATRSNVPALVNSPLLLRMCVEHIATGTGAGTAENDIGRQVNSSHALLLRLVEHRDERVHRLVYLHAGLVLTLVEDYDKHDGYAYTTGRVLQALLSVSLANKQDFVREGHAARLGRMISRSHEGNAIVCSCLLLLRLIVDMNKTARDGDYSGSEEEDEDEDYAVLRSQVLHAPGVMLEVGELTHHPTSFVLLLKLAKQKRLAQEILLDLPDLVQNLLAQIQRFNTRHAEDMEWTMMRCMTRLLTKAPYAALACRVKLADAFVRIVEQDYHTGTRPVTSNYAYAYLASWQSALAGQHRSRAQANNNDPFALIAYWCNMPKLWTVLSTPHRKRRSPLRRLPGEMFRLLKDTLCGSGATRSST